MLIDFIQRTGVATRRWLLQGAEEKEEEDEWGWVCGGWGRRTRGGDLSFYFFCLESFLYLYFISIIPFLP